MRTEREKMLAGELYGALDPELVAARTRARDLCQALTASPRGRAGRTTPHLVRAVWRRRRFGVDAAAVLLRLRLEHRARRARVLQLQLRGARRVLGSPRQLHVVRIYTPMRPFDAALRRRREFAAPIEIGEDVWVGGGAIILPGVHIGSRAVIGAGSVVTRDVPAGMFAAGNPCPVIREVAAQ
jgi:maltose O-acetyltransferase